MNRNTKSAIRTLPKPKYLEHSAQIGRSQIGFKPDWKVREAEGFEKHKPVTKVSS